MPSLNLSQGTKSLRINHDDRWDVPAAFPELERFRGQVVDLDDLLIFCTDQHCSDLFIKLDEQPYINRWGKIYKVPSEPLDMKSWNTFEQVGISSENNAAYVRSKMLDFSYEVLHECREYRYRVSAGFSCGKKMATFRMITNDLPTFSSANIPDDLQDLLRDCMQRREGISLLCGVTGSGKTTTLATCFSEFCQDGGPFADANIITLEDPIEYLYPSTSTTRVAQKELGKDFESFALGIKQALREHPNIIGVGEARDAETIRTLVEASRTGHAVYSTFHTSSVADTVARLYSYLAQGQSDVIYDLISNMNVVICQKLIPDNGTGYRLTTQYMRFIPQVVKVLNEAIMKDLNIPMVINELFQNDTLVRSKVVKDWS